MSQPFAFPPPPPPPPKRDLVSNTSGAHYPQLSRGGNIGRGSYRNNQGQRGGSHSVRSRGYDRGRGSSRAAHLGATKPRQLQNGQLNLNRESVAQINSPNNQNLTAVQNSKRDYSSAFPRNNLPNHRPKAAPPVPSFGIDFETILPKRPSSTAPKSPVISRKTNILGLTPSGQDSEPESDADEDDEARLASTITGNTITFEHKGQTLSLKSPAEIAAWIAERRTKFPTQAKAEAAKKEAESKKQQWEEEKKARREASKVFRDQQLKDRAEREKKRLREKLINTQIQKGKAALAEAKADPAGKARLKAEKLRKRAARAAQELREAEEALQEAERSFQSNENSDEEQQLEVLPDARKVHKSNDLQGMVTQNSNIVNERSLIDCNAAEFDDETGALSDFSSSSSAEDTSSSGSSDSETDSDIDGAPEESSSKRDAPERVPPPKRTAMSNDKPICHNLQKFGRCKFGRKCRYSHEVNKPGKIKTKGDQPLSGRRKGLYQIMVEKEEQQAREQALRAIIAIGEQGLLEEKTGEGVKSTELRLQVANTMAGDIVIEVEDPIT